MIVIILYVTFVLAVVAFLKRPTEEERKQNDIELEIAIREYLNEIQAKQNDTK